MDVLTTMPLDYENATNVFAVEVMASDGALSSLFVLQVTVTNTNDAPIVNSSAVASVAENLPSGSQVGTRAGIQVAKCSSATWNAAGSVCQ
jgi:hypothetical protein